MVKRTLIKKSIRDMKKAKVQFISIFIMATLAVSIVTGLDSIWKTLEDNAVAMYTATNLSDLWVTVTNPTEKQLWSIKKIEGVETAEKRFMAEASADVTDSPTLRVYTTSAQNILDLPSLQEGKFISRGGAILDKTFAQAHGLTIGDDISIKVNGKWLRFPIEGLALSSEHIFSVKGSTSMMPDAKKYGFIIIHEDRIKSFYGQKMFNQVCVKLGPGADVLQVQKQIDEALGDDLLGIIARNDSSSVSDVNAKIQQFKTLATIFPLMFFLVTALITQSTMTRMVENQRSQIGILKALGYKKRSILWHYTSYGVYVGLLGAASGLLIGPNVFGRILIPSLKLNFSDPRLLINYENFVYSTLLILLCTGGISLYVCLKLQRDTPAVLLRDKPPREGSHIFLEFIPKLWKMMKFSSKLIARNTLKNKMRLLMSIMGITGCTGLIVAALTISSMINGIVDQTYGQTFTYDQKIILDRKADSRYIYNEKLDGITQAIQEQAVGIVSSDGLRQMKLLTVSPRESPLIHLKDIDGNAVPLREDGITLTRKLAETLNVEVGDSIELKRTDDSYIQVPVRQIIYMAFGQGMYMTDTYWESIGEDFKPTALLMKWNAVPDEGFLQGDYVKEYIDRTSQMSDIKSNIRVVYTAVVMLIAMGAILAFVALYNSSILNFAERTRDLATLRVLGFYQKEIRFLVLVENILSVLFGAFAGVPVGRMISDMVARGLGDQMDLIGNITVGTVALAGITTLIFALIVNSVVAQKMKDIDMLQTLKSVE